MLRLSFMCCYLDVISYLCLCRSVLCFSSINLSNVSNLSWNKMLTLQFPVAFVRKGSIYDKLALVRIRGMRRTGDKPIPKSVMVDVPGCICARSQWPVTGGLIYKHGLNLILVRISNLIPGKSRGEITYTFPNLNSYTVEVWEWISNFTPHFMNRCNYLSMRGLKLNNVSKRGPGRSRLTMLTSCIVR